MGSRSWVGADDGTEPMAGLVADGQDDASPGYVFELTPPTDGRHEWTETRFGGFKKIGARNPENVPYGKDHNLYGVLNFGNLGLGAVFELK